MILQRANQQVLAVPAGQRSAAAGLGLAALAVVVGLVAGRTVDSDQVDGYGILFALPALYWVAVAAAVAASVVLLRLAVVSEIRYATILPLLWLALVHTSPHLAHDHFRFPTVWTHLGFVRMIDRLATGDVLVDARFAWPGFFGAFIAPIGNVGDGTIELLMRLWPTVILGATSILVAALANRSYPTVRLIGPLSALVYVLLAWTGQDYFSPQSFGFTAYLSILVILESGPLRTSPAWSARVPFLARFAAAGGDRPAPRSTPAFVALVVLSFGAIVSHPLAPFFICMGMIILALYGRTLAWRLLVMIGVAYAAWFVVAAEPFWSTRVAEMVGEIGSFFTNLDASTSDRVATSSLEHLFVTRVRTAVGLGTIVSVLVIGIAMATDRFRHLRPAIPLAPLAGIPSMAMILQSYGGEIVFRVVLFTLPMAAILIGRVLAAVQVRALPVVVPLLTAALLPALMLARFGNEAFEMTTATDREAVLAAYAGAGEDDTLFVSDNGFLPWFDRTVGANRFAEHDAAPTEAFVAAVEADAARSGKSRVIVIFTPSQSQWRVHGLSSPAGYLDEVGRFLARRPGASVLYQRNGGWAIEL